MHLLKIKVCKAAVNSEYCVLHSKCYLPCFLVLLWPWSLLSFTVWFLRASCSTIPRNDCL